jgi:L-ornithine Nalpha-acyltransferase
MEQDCVVLEPAEEVLERRPQTFHIHAVHSRSREPSISGRLGEVGSLEVRLAVDASETEAAQRLRHAVFFGQAGQGGVDRCRFDPFCDHLIVVDRDCATVVGTYRLLRREQALAGPGFYSATEFDIAPMLARHKGLRFLEVGRSCVAPAYRSGRTIELLWRGLWAYVRHHRIDALFGCASFEGTDPVPLTQPLSFLHHNASAETAWRVEPLSDAAIPMDVLDTSEVDPAVAIAALPPLIKGYLRVGGKIGGGAVLDHVFQTTDVFVTLRMDQLTPRYARHLSRMS